MAEADSEAERAARQANAAADPAALAAAMGPAGASEQAREYLAKQSSLADLQMTNLRLQNETLEKLDEYETSHLRWRRFNDRMLGAWQILLVLVGSAVVGVIVAAVWSASQSEGLVVDSFSVPASFAQTGATGEVVAQDMTDRVAAVRDTANANSIAHSNDVRLDSDEQIKIAIPDTSISLGERVLRCRRASAKGAAWRAIVVTSSCRQPSRAVASARVEGAGKARQSPAERWRERLPPAPCQNGSPEASTATRCPASARTGATEKGSGHA